MRLFLNLEVWQRFAGKWAIFYPIGADLGLKAKS
jgi:hypothetical protein